MKLRHIFACAAAVPGLFAARSLEAAPSARLVYVRDPGAESCPDAVAIESAVAARLGYSPFFSAAAATMMLTLSREDDGYRAMIRLVDENGKERGVRELELRAARCDEIVDTVALSMSIAIDPSSLERPTPIAPTPAAQDSTAATSASPDTRPSPSPASNGAEARLRVEAGAGAGVWTGAAPDVSFSGTMFGRVRLGRASMSLEARGDMPASRALPAATVQTWLAFGSVVPCFHVDPILVCLVGSAGVLGATSNARISNQDNAFHAAVGPRLGLQIPLGRSFALWGHLDALWTLTPEKLWVGGVDVYDLAALSGGVTLGASVHIF